MLVKSKIKREGGTQLDMGTVKLHFAPNVAGDHVCEVEDPIVLDRLINQLPEGFELYGDDAGKQVDKPAKKTLHFEHPLVAKGEAKPVEQEKMIIKNGDVELDLMTLDLDAARAFATNEMKIDVHPRWKVETIRAKIVEATRASGE